MVTNQNDCCGHKILPNHANLGKPDYSINTSKHYLPTQSNGIPKQTNKDTPEWTEYAFYREQMRRGGHICPPPHTHTHTHNYTVHQ